VFKRGYGMFNAGRFLNGKQDTRYAHRLAYQLTTGDIPSHLEVMHSCDVPRCVNPAHLSLGTHGDNIRDAAAKGRMAVEHPKAWTFPRELIPPAHGPRGTAARVAREHGVSGAALANAVRRARDREMRHAR
jgi:hypothetical protein